MELAEYQTFVTTVVEKLNIGIKFTGSNFVSFKAQTILPVGDTKDKNLGVLGLGEASLSLDPTFLGTKLSTLEALKGLILKIPGAITLSLFTTVDSREEGAEFEVTGFDITFDLPTLGITIF
ncbi:hypothetical protein Tco_0545746 [Tanacetum coccineum]